MAHIFREKFEIPIPSNAYINHSDGRVFIFLREGKSLEQSRRKVIGRAASNSTMYPNATFRYMFPSLWEEYYGVKERLPERSPHVGLYALCLGVGHKTNVYPLLHKSHGPLYANAIMDFVMHSMITKTDVAQTFPETMRKEITFSSTVPSDEFLSDMFTSKMKTDMNEAFIASWMEQCKSDGTAEAWISIDGSNIDCASEGCDLAEWGHAKSRNNLKVVSYMYAVNAQTGMPITYMTYNGSKVDSKAFMRMSAYLKSYGIKAKGVILDRGFCTPDVFNELKENNIPYVIMLKSDTYAHTEMCKKSSGEVYWNLSHLIDKESLFGISSDTRQKVFKSMDMESYISLFFDGINGTERKTTLIRKVMNEANRLSEKISEGEDVSVNDQLAKYISIDYENGQPALKFNYENWQNAVDIKGFYSLATSEHMDASESSHLYNLRDKSETQYMFQKSQLGFDVMRVQSQAALESKFFVCFVASIVRNMIVRSCQKEGLDSNTNRVITDIDRINLMLTESGTYLVIHDESTKQKKLLASVGILPADLDTLAEEVNMRKNPIASLFRQIPQHNENQSGKPGRGRKKKEKPEADAPEKIKRPVGRPKGSGKKKDEDAHEPTEKKKAGRPKGSLNKKTIEAQKRGKGRPKGSKNRKTLEKEAAEAAARAALPKRGPGRPKGSKNKPSKK